MKMRNFDMVFPRIKEKDVFHSGYARESSSKDCSGYDIRH